MDNSGKQVEYNSADIRKKPKEDLVTNVRNLTRAEKLQRFFTVENTKIIIAALLVVAALSGLTITLILIYSPTGVNSESSLSADEREINEIEKEVGAITPKTDGEDIWATIEDIDARVESARESGNEVQVYRLRLTRIDAHLKAGLGEFVVEDMNDIIAENRDNDSRLYDLYSRGIAACVQTGDIEIQRLYLEQIVSLPEDVFPNGADDTWKGYYINMLEKL